MFTDVMLEYFRGERFEAFIVILPKGLAMIHTLVLKGARIRAPVRASGAQCVHLV